LWCIDGDKISRGQVLVSSKKTRKKGKHVSLSIQDKVQIHEELEASVSMASIIDGYSTAEQTASDMKRGSSSVQ
jgi:hypothetical protein